VALVVSVPLAGAAASAKTAPATSRSHGPVARSAALQVLALGVVSNLLRGATQKAGSEGFGWLLDQIGLGDSAASELASEISGISGQLREIQAQLSDVLAATVQIRADLAQGTFSGLVAQATPIVARVDKGVEDLVAVANLPADDPARKGFAHETLRYIGEKLMGGEQEELAKRITGEVGADGLIVAAYKVAKTTSPCCWNDLTSHRVREVFRYYEWAEVRLLLLRVEYMHAHPDKYPGSYVADQIQKVEQQIQAQQAMLRPSPEEFAFDDTRTHLEWSWYFLSYRWDAIGARYITDYNGKDGWRMPTVAEINKLISVRNVAKWAEWLNRETGDEIAYFFGGPINARFTGVWTSEFGRYGSQTIDPDGYSVTTPNYSTRGVLMVRERKLDYWY
jgi:hypothetical protein